MCLVNLITSYSTIWILFTLDGACGKDMCPMESQGETFWSATDSFKCVRSNPFCLNDKMEIVLRCCLSGGNWADSPFCTYYQDTINNPCPETFDWNSNICIFSIKDSMYPPQCPYEEILPFDQYISVINSDLFPIWMPVKRNIGDYGIDVLRWEEASSKFKTAFDDYYYNDTLADKNCVIYHNSSLVEAVSCEENHTAICAYQSLPDKLTSFCSQSQSKSKLCVQSNYASYSKCFCKGLMQESYLMPRAEFHKPYQNLLYYSLNDTCYIGLEKLNDLYIWRNSNTTIEYSNWAEEAIFDEDYIYGAMTSKGWIMTKNESEHDCVLYEVDVPSSKSDVILDFSADEEQFILSLTNPETCVFGDNDSIPLVFCFTDASSNSIISRIAFTRYNVTGDKAIFYFPKHSDGPGNYWCEAFLHPEIVAKKSNTYLLRYNDSYTEEYVVILKTSYPEETNPITEINISEYQKLLTNQIQSLQSISHFQVRIYKIIALDENNLSITINFHLVNPNKSTPLGSYSLLRGHMEQNLRNFTFIDVLGVDHCVGMQNSQSSVTVTWPATPVNTNAQPREGYCIGKDGFIINRHCFGNYIDGAKWSDLIDSCSTIGTQQSINATVNLTNIVYLNNPKEYMDQVVEIVETKNFELVAQDIELISIFFGQVATSSDIDLNSIKVIVNQLMKVPQEVLTESQALFNSTDKILYQIHNIINQSNFIGELVTENVFITSYSVHDCNPSAIVISENSSNCYNIAKVCNPFNLSDIFELENLKIAFFLNESLISELIRENVVSSRIIVTIYKNSSLFNEVNQPIKDTDIIIGLTFPDSKRKITGEIYYFNYDSEGNEINCSFWNYQLNNQKGYWAEAQQNTTNTSVTCIYDSPMHVTIIQNEEVNVTRELETIVNSDEDLLERLNATFKLLTNYYTNFQPVDINLVCQMLHIAAKLNVQDLQLVTDIVNVIADVNKEVLEKSQKAYNATGKILFYFDIILQNFLSAQIVETNNIYVSVQLLNDKRFYGFTLQDYNGERIFKLIEENLDITSITNFDNLDTALIVNDYMLEQLLHYYKQDYVPKIVTTVFFKDSLFIEEYKNLKIITKVIRVAFPNFDDKQEGALTLLFNIHTNLSLDYTCSVYQSDKDDSDIINGFWNPESAPLLENGFRLCKFWEPSYFAVSYSLQNLTMSLESMLHSDESIEIVLSKTSTITKNYYQNLQAVDLYIIAQIFSKVNYSNEVILKVCWNILDDIMSIDDSIIRNSQKIYNSTNLILDSINNIANIFNGNIYIEYNNVALIISLLEETGMYGITLEKCFEHCILKILYNRDAFTQNTIVNEFDVELTLSTNLLNTLLEAKNQSYVPMLVLKMFYNDTLFINNNDPRNTNQIFGIHFPHYHQTLSNEIRVTYNPTTSSGSDTYTCVSWMFRNESDNNKNGYWFYESRPRDTETISCNYYEQNYFSLIDGNAAVQVTDILEHISNTNSSSLSKLYRTQDISYYYQQFQPHDIYLISCILLQCDETSTDGLDMLNTIINNILRTPEEVLLDSNDNRDTLRRILQGINHIASFKGLRRYSLLNDQFGLIICELNSNSSNGIILTTYDIKCTHDIQDSSFSHAENVVATLIFPEEIINEAMQHQKVIATVFLNNILFGLESIGNNTLVLGLSIPIINNNNNLDGDITILLNDSLCNKCIYYCAYWEDLVLWKAKNADSIGSFKKCTYSAVTYFTIMDNSYTNNATEILTNIINAHCSQLEKLIETEEVISRYTDKFSVDDVYLVSLILSDINDVDNLSLNHIANIINIIMCVSRDVLIDSQNKYSATDWILYHIDRIIGNIREETLIENENFAIAISKNMSGLFVEKCNRLCNLQIITDMNYINLKDNMYAALILNDTLRREIENYPTPYVMVTVYFTDALFNGGLDVIYKNIGPIMGIIIPSQNETLKESIELYYFTDSHELGDCAFWNYTVEGTSISKGHWERNRSLYQPSQSSFCESKYPKHFALLQVKENITNDLENILKSNSTITEKLEAVALIMTDLAPNLQPIDVFLISKILQCALEEIDMIKINLTSHIVSSLFLVPRSVLRESQTTYYATDQILHTVEEMTRSLSSIFVHPIVRDNFTIAIYDLKERNISGILLENCSDAQCSISVLEGTVNLTELVGNENLQMAVTLSDKLQNQLRNSDGFPKLVVTIYFSDVLFNEESERVGNVSMVCGVLLPGFNETLLGSLYLLFNNADGIHYNSSCAFWDFQMDDAEDFVQGSWKSLVDPSIKDRFTICEHDHITHFALLLARDNSSFAEGNKYKILDIITGVSSVLSIIGLFGILLTALIFERWRRNTGNQILVHFSVAVSIKMIMLYVSAGVYSDGSREVVCYVTGGILHYSILSEFCWMLIIAILQFKRFVEVLGGPPKFVLLKACICGWLFPALPVALILLIDKQNYVEGEVGLCYPSGLGLYLGIWLPLIIIVAINFVIFIFIMYNVFHKKTETRDLVNHEILFQWRLALLLFSMLGLTWLFGFMSQIPGAENIFVYIFCISATLQGFIMFLFFIVFNKSTRFLYSQSIKLWLYSKGYKLQ